MRHSALSSRLCRLALALSVLVALSADAAAKAVPTGYRIEEGNWGGGGYNDEDGGFAFCFIGTQTADGNRYGVFLLSDASLWLTLMNDSWTLSPDKSYPASVEADHTRRQVDGEVKMDAIVFDLHQDPGFFNAMRHGEELRFVGASSTIGITLRPDTFDALTALEVCLAKHAGLNLQGKWAAPGSSPFDSPQTSDSPLGSSTAASPAPSAGGQASSENPFASAGSAPALAPMTAPGSGSNGDVNGDALANLVLKAISSAGYPSPELQTSDGGYSWTSAKTGVIGTFLVNDPRNFPEAYVEKMESLGEDCGPTLRLSYDTVLTTRSGREVYGATLQCSAKNYQVHQATLVDSSVALMFFHVSTTADAPFAARINKKLRDYLRDNW